VTSTSRPFSKISRAPLAGECGNFLRTQSIVYEQCQSGLPVCWSCRTGTVGREERARYSLWSFRQGRKKLSPPLSLSLYLPLSLRCPLLRPSGKKPHRPFPRRTRSFVLTSTASNKPAEIKVSRAHTGSVRSSEDGTRSEDA